MQLCFSTKKQDLTIDANGNYLVHKDIFESKTGIKLTSNLNEMYDLTELASIHGYEVNNGEFNIILTRKFGTKRLIVETKNANLNFYGAVAVSNYDNFYILQFKTETQTKEAYNFYLNSKDVLNVNIEGLCWVENETSELNENLSLNSKSKSYNSWGAEVMYVPEYNQYLSDLLNAENTSYTKLPEVVVAVLDSGIDTDHPLFKGRILKDKNGNYVGEDFTGQNKTGYSFEDKHGHGSMCAGIICDLTLPNVKILPVKISATGSAEYSDVFKAMDYVVKMSKTYNIVAMNYSFSAKHDDYFHKIYKSKIEKLYNAGIYSIVSAGNDSSSVACPGDVSTKCITVSALDQDLTIADYSNYGPTVDVSAPGTGIISADINGGLKSGNGTSFSAPHISAYIALIKSNPKRNWTMQDIDKILTGEFREYHKQTIRKLSNLSPEIKSSFYGYGMPTCEGIYETYYTVNTSTNSKGSISPSGFNLYQNDHINIKLSFDFLPNEGHYVNAVYLNGRLYDNVEKGDTKHTFKLHSTNNELYVEFKRGCFVNYYREPINEGDNFSSAKYNLYERNFYFNEADVLKATQMTNYEGFTPKTILQKMAENLLLEQKRWK